MRVVRAYYNYTIFRTDNTFTTTICHNLRNRLYEALGIAIQCFVRNTHDVCTTYDRALMVLRLKYLSFITIRMIELKLSLYLKHVVV